MSPVYSVTYVPGPYPALCSVGLLDVLHEYGCGGLGRSALSSRPFRSFATTRCEKCGLGYEVVVFRLCRSTEKRWRRLQPSILTIDRHMLSGAEGLIEGFDHLHVS